jgi:hypothetical protein
MKLINNSGLKPTPSDPRDYDYHKTFGAADVVLPDEYFAGKPLVKNQELSEMCTAFGSYVLAACEDGVDFLPEWSFAAGKTISKTDPEEPEDLRTPLKTAVKMGYCPTSPLLPSLATQSPRYCGILANYPASTVQQALKYLKKSYFRVDGDFNSVRRVLYDNRASRRAILTGVLWMNEWTAAPGGIVPDFAVSPGGLHCIAIIGFIKKNGIDYIVVQNSYGTDIGDQGIFYFDEKTFNAEFTQPMFMIVDTDDSAPAPKTIGSWLSVLFYKLFKR